MFTVYIYFFFAFLYFFFAGPWQLQHLFSNILQSIEFCFPIKQRFIYFFLVFFVFFVSRYDMSGHALDQLKRSHGFGYCLAFFLSFIIKRVPPV